MWVRVPPRVLFFSELEELVGLHVNPICVDVFHLSPTDFQCVCPPNGFKGFGSDVRATHGRLDRTVP